MKETTYQVAYEMARVMRLLAEGGSLVKELKFHNDLYTGTVDIPSGPLDKTLEFNLQVGIFHFYDLLSVAIPTTGPLAVAYDAIVRGKLTILRIGVQWVEKTPGNTVPYLFFIFMDWRLVEVEERSFASSISIELIPDLYDLSQLPKA